MKTEETWVLVAMEVKGRCRELDDMSGLACCGFSPAQRETIPATVVAGDGGLCYCFFFLFFFFSTSLNSTVGTGDVIHFPLYVLLPSSY